MSERCGAKRRGGDGTCKLPAGWGTDHVGTGRCKLHGGASVRGAEHPRFKHGLYSKYLPDTIQAKADQFLEADPLELVSEQALLRAIVAEYAALPDDKPLSSRYLTVLADLVDRVGRFSERMNKMRNDSALTGAEITYLAARVADVVVKYLDDPDEQRAFIADLVGVMGRSGDDADQPALVDRLDARTG